MSVPAREPSPFEAGTQTFEDRRQHRRFKGPFDGRRVDLIDTPVRIYDLSQGGCFIHSSHAQKPRIELTLKIDLPGETEITAQAVTLPQRNDFGFAVRFTSMEPDDAMRFHLALKRLEEREP